MHQVNGGRPVGRGLDLGQPSLIFCFDVIGHRALFVNKGMILEIEERDSLRGWKRKFFIEGLIKEFGAPLAVAHDIEIPYAPMDLEWRWSSPRWRLGQPSLIAPVFRDEPPLLPSVPTPTLEFFFHLRTAPETTWKFPDKVFGGAKYSHGWSFSGVVPFQIGFLNEALMLWRKIGDDPWSVNRNNGVGAAPHFPAGALLSNCLFLHFRYRIAGLLLCDFLRPICGPGEPIDVADSAPHLPRGLFTAPLHFRESATHYDQLEPGNQRIENCRESDNRSADNISLRVSRTLSKSQQPTLPFGHCPPL
jgi:hypothetical protein